MKLKTASDWILLLETIQECPLVAMMNQIAVQLIRTLSTLRDSFAEAYHGHHVLKDSTQCMLCL